MAAFGELEVYNGRVESVRKLYFDIASFDQAIILSELTILRERTVAALVAKPPEDGNLRPSQSAHLGRPSIGESRSAARILRFLFHLSPPM